MTRISFVSPAGKVSTVDVKDGLSVMEAAVRNDVPGIDGECGGACACATCHVYIADEWLERVGEAPEMEQNMLEFANNLRPTSRLSCQITLRAELDGLVVHTPENQQGAI